MQWEERPLTNDQRAAKEEKWTPEGIPYVRIEHVTDPSEESLEKAAEKGISFVTQPIFLYAESASYLGNLGAQWIKQCYPIKHILDKGVCLGLFHRRSGNLLVSAF